MNRVTRGTVVLAAVLGAMSCKGDPTSDLRNGVDHLVATPGAIFQDAGSVKSVVIEAVDEQGNRLATSYSATATGAITVDRDPTWNAVYDNKGNLTLPSKATSAKFIVTSTGTPSDAKVTVSAGGKTIDIPVRVLPLSVPVTYSNASPNPGDTVTLSVAAPFKLRPSVTITTGTDPVHVVSFAADSSSISFVPTPRTASAPVEVNGVVLTFLPSVSLNLPAETNLNLTGYAGTDDNTTAPTLTIPATGATSFIRDIGDFAANATCTGGLGGPCRIYKIVLAAPTNFSVSTTWEGSTDLGIYFFNAAFTGLVATTTGAAGCDAHGSGATGQPEACSLTLAAGTYYLVVDTFSPFYAAPDNVDPVYFDMTITGD